MGAVVQPPLFETTLTNPKMGLKSRGSQIQVTHRRVFRCLSIAPTLDSVGL